ncbi:YfiR family protein [Ketobacter sp. MCCC 1A13808]|nr:YfiR family protein [Ketobacter sp. MCCC 1A13808]RLP55687.1 MAG: YfiR family protein [Ketobacter sp.]
MKTGLRHWRHTALTTLVLFACLKWSALCQASIPGEYDVKLVYLYNFTKYLTWSHPFPEGDTDSPYIICVMGKLPSDVPLADLKSKTTRNHPIDIRLLAKYTPTTNCHILFLTKSLGRKYIRDITSASTPDMLVVGETSDFARDNGEIGFVLDEKNRVRLEINLQRVQQKDMSIRSQLLEIARKVYRVPEEHRQ